MAWAYGSYAGGRALVLVSVAILARLLTPEDFGLVAFAMTCIALLETLKDLGVNQALVLSRPEDESDPAATDTAFYTSLAVSVLLAGALVLAAAIMSRPSLSPLLAVLGANIPLRALGATHAALAARALDFRTRTVAELGDVVVRGVVGIALALAGAGPWSLVLGYLAGSVVYSATLWWRVPWRPRLRFDRSCLRQLVSFGGASTGVDVVAAYGSNIDNFLVGGVLGSSALGFYSIAFRLPQLAIQNLAVVAGQVLFPAFASVDRASLGRAYLTSLRGTTLLTVPVTVLMGTLAEPILVVAFGAQWRPAAATMAVLTLYAGLSTVGFPAGVAYRAMGRPGVLLALSIPRALLLTAMLLVLTSHGNVAVAACQAVTAGLLAIASTVLAGHRLATGVPAIGRAMAPAAIAGVATLAVAQLANQTLSGELLRLLVGGGAGIGAYVAVLAVLARRSPVRLLRSLRTVVS